MLLFVELQKAEDPQAYKKIAEKGLLLGHPVSIAGQSHRPDNGIPYHMTIKMFDSDKERPSDAHGAAQHLRYHTPDPAQTRVEPAVLKDRFGNDTYGIKLVGNHQKSVEENRTHLAHMGYPGHAVNYPTHITVDKATFDKVFANKPSTAAEAGISFGPAQLRQGHAVLAQYASHTPAAPKEEDKLAASEPADINPLDKSNYGPAGMDLYNQADNARRKMGRTAEEVEGAGPNKAVKYARPSLNDQAEAEAKEMKRRSKANPVKVYTEAEKRAFIKARAQQEKAVKKPKTDVAGKPKRKVKGKGKAKIKSQVRKKRLTRLAASEDMSPTLEKGLKHLGTALGTAAALTAATPVHSDQGVRPAVYRTIQQAPSYSSQDMLHAIASVESSGGKQMDHRSVGGIHHGEKAYGKYALMPHVIRETIGLNADLKAKHKRAMMLHGQDLHRYMQDNPELEDQVAQRHLQRLEHHFGQNPSAIGYAWLEGIRGTYRAQKEHEDIDNHWYPQRIKQAYGKGI